jgi:hypothetical protein
LLELIKEEQLTQFHLVEGLQRHKEHALSPVLEAVAAESFVYKSPYFILVDKDSIHHNINLPIYICLNLSLLRMGIDLQRMGVGIYGLELRGSMLRTLSDIYYSFEIELCMLVVLAQQVFY